VKIANAHPLTGIVVLNWNGWRDTIECLASLRDLEPPGAVQILVVDNASTDDSVRNITAWTTTNRLSSQLVLEHEIPSTVLSADIIIIRAQFNGGFAKGNNIGIIASLKIGCNYVWLLNNDTTVDPKALVALVNKTDAAADVGMCGSVLRYYDDRKTIQAVGGVKFDFRRAMGEQIGQGEDISALADISDKVKDLTYIAGASMLLRNEFLHEVGLMEESYFLYFEELDWAVRSAGKWRIAVALDSHVFHKEGGSIGTASRSIRSSLAQYYLNRNLIRFYLLHKPHLLPIALLRGLKEAYNCFAAGEFGHAKLTMRAVFEGLRGESGASTLARSAK
jgi:GT2 family glycosyltransferase